MTISTKIKNQLQNTSLIRKMFEEGALLKQKKGAENVYDFSLGNPAAEPPDKFFLSLQKFISERKPGCHRYMYNTGLQSSREKLAQHLSRKLNLALTPSHVSLGVGAGGCMNVTLKVLLDAEDEVIVISPYFPEYTYYIDSHCGRMRIVTSKSDFDLDIDALEKAITSKTKAVIINSPNNPTGKIYSSESLQKLACMLENVSEKMNRCVYLISDEPYRDLIYNQKEYPAPLCHYKNTIMIYSFSKSLSIPGERIGYLAIHPEMEEGDLFMAGCKQAMRALGFVNAPAIMQHIIPDLLDVLVDVDQYKSHRDLLVDTLLEAGYELEVPEGAFYLFPKAPTGDDLAFTNYLKEDHSILTIPSSGFGIKGYFRIAYCVEKKVIQNSLEGFRKAVGFGR